MEDQLPNQHQSTRIVDLTGGVLSLGAAALVCLMVFFNLRNSIRGKGKNQPPGPWALPLIGNLSINNCVSLQQRCVEWQKVYGSIFRIQLGTRNVIIVNDAKILKEFLAMEESLNRPHESVIYQLNRGYMGIVSLNGKAWAENRRFCLRLLGDLGFGKTAMENLIKLQMQSVVDMTGEAKGSAIPIGAYLFTVSFNVISAILCGTDYKLDDSKGQELQQHLISIIREFHADTLIDVKPVWLSTIMADVPFTRIARMRRSMRVLREFLGDRVKERRESLEGTRTRDFIDGYLQQMEQEGGDPNSHFQECHLLGCALDFILTGVASPPTSIQWLLLVCAQRPDEVQSRIHAEIDHTVGRERQPSWKDRLEMPFTMASIWEILRWKTPKLFGVPRGVEKDILLAGFLIPKGAVVLPNNIAMTRNSSYWKQPDDFDPTRFLNSDGSELNKKPDCLIPFTFGKRMCPGETLSMVQLFLYTTFLLQKYSIHPQEGREIPCLDSLANGGKSPALHMLRFLPR